MPTTARVRAGAFVLLPDDGRIWKVDFVNQCRAHLCVPGTQQTTDIAPTAVLPVVPLVQLLESYIMTREDADLAFATFGANLVANAPPEGIQKMVAAAVQCVKQGIIMPDPGATFPQTFCNLVADGVYDALHDVLAKAKFPTPRVVWEDEPAPAPAPAPAPVKAKAPGPTAVPPPAPKAKAAPPAAPKPAPSPAKGQDDAALAAHRVHAFTVDPPIVTVRGLTVDEQKSRWTVEAPKGTVRTVTGFGLTVNGKTAFVVANGGAAPAYLAISTATYALLARAWDKGTPRGASVAFWQAAEAPAKRGPGRPPKAKAEPPAPVPVAPLPAKAKAPAKVGTATALRASLTARAAAKRPPLRGGR